MSEPKAPFQLRFASPGLKRRLEEQARNNLRSLNAEINARLIMSLEKENAPAAATVEALDTK